MDILYPIVCLVSHLTDLVITKNQYFRRPREKGKKKDRKKLCADWLVEPGAAALRVSVRRLM